MSVSIDMTGKVMLFTGIDSGEGKNIALCMAKAGTDVVATYSAGSEDLAATFQKETETLGRRCKVVAADSANIDDMKRVAEEVKDFFGKLDVLVHNAGNDNRALLKDMTVDLWESSHKAHTEGPVFLTQALLPLLKGSEERGRVLNICSEDYYSLEPGKAPHVNAMACFVKFMQTLTVETEPAILANTVIACGCGKGTYTDEKGRIWNGCTAESVAELLMYLSVCVPTLNGATIPVDGGYGLLNYRNL